MTRRIVFTLLLALLGAAACDGSGLVDAKGNTWLRFIDSEGGTLISQDGRFVFRFPKGSLEKGQGLEIRQRTAGPARFAGVVYEVTRIDGGVGEIALKKPATVSLRFVDTPQYLEPPRLARVTRGDAWVPLDAVLESGKLVSRSVISTGTFGAFDVCSGDAACGGGLVCNDGACARPECGKNADCGAGHECLAGRCADQGCKDTCEKDAGCGTDETCDVQVNGCRECVYHKPTCVPVQEICDNGADDDCDGFIDATDDDCAETGCRDDQGCPRDTYCVEGMCVACKDNYQCDTYNGFVCTTEKHDCEMVWGCAQDTDCPPDAGCAMYSFTETFCYSCPPPDSPLRCTDDLSCGKGNICEHWGWGPGCSICLPAQCSDTASCPGGEKCLGGRCVNPLCVDKDGDGFPAAAGCGTDQLDCDDTNQYVHPGMREDCNGIDDDCRGGADDGDPYEMCRTHPPGGGTCNEGRCF